VDIDVRGWPWITDEQPSLNLGNTFLQMFFLNSALLDHPGNVIGKDDGQDFYFTASSDDVFIHLQFLKVMTTDGIDSYASVNNFIPLNFTQATTVGPFPGILMVCDHANNPIVPRYKHLYWDPSLDAVFSPLPSPPPSSTPTSSSKKPVYPIAVGVSLGIVALLVIVVLLLYIFFPPFKSLIRR